MSATKQLAKLLLAGAVLHGAVARGQNPVTSPPTVATAPTANAAPCIPPPPQKCGFVCREEQRLRIQAAIKSCQLTKGNVCDSPDIPINSPKPCPVPVAPPPAPSPAPATVPESKPLISEDGRHIYICVGGSHKNAELPICELPDGRYLPMQELPIPPGSLIKTGTTNGDSPATPSPAAQNTTSTTPLTDAKPNPNAVTGTPTH
jgi:hypothetical protein